VLYLRFLAQLLSLAGIRAVGVILVDRQGRFLLQQRELELKKDDEFGHPARGYLKGRWAIPAGYIERGETPHAAAVRELREELGVEVELRPVVRATWPRPVYLYAAGIGAPLEALKRREAIDQRFVVLGEVSGLSRRIPLLGSVLRSFAATRFYERCRKDASA
jgi:8-oxo-dGTP pyrophosphatase MutT (NUDIX family)